MTPEEFVKRWGLSEFKIAKSLPAFRRYKYTIIYSDEIDFANEFDEKHKDYMFESKDIDRIVLSHGLIERLGGIQSATKIALKQHELGHIINEGLILSSIRDVRACQ